MLHNESENTLNHLMPRLVRFADKNFEPENIITENHTKKDDRITYIQQIDGYSLEKIKLISKFLIDNQLLVNLFDTNVNLHEGEDSIELNSYYKFWDEFLFNLRYINDDQFMTMKSYIQSSDNTILDQIGGVNWGYEDLK